jgi:Tfp pilus assembly protein PilP
MATRIHILAGTLALSALAGTTGVAAAQAPAAPAAPAPPAAAAPAPTPAPYTYNADGRRDPFVSLVARGSDSKTAARGLTTDGLASLTVADVSVRGVMQSRGGYVAILQGSDHKTYIARANDRLQDGTIRKISAQGLLILQEVTDPLSLVKQKEVHKGLRESDEGK